MSFWTYLPYIQYGLVVINDTSQCLKELSTTKPKPTFWDILVCTADAISTNLPMIESDLKRDKAQLAKGEKQ